MNWRARPYAACTDRFLLELISTTRPCPGQSAARRHLKRVVKGRSLLPLLHTRLRSDLDSARCRRRQVVLIDPPRKSEQGVARAEWARTRTAIRARGPRAAIRERSTSPARPAHSLAAAERHQWLPTQDPYATRNQRRRRAYRLRQQRRSNRRIVPCWSVSSILLALPTRAGSRAREGDPGPGTASKSPEGFQAS